MVKPALGKGMKDLLPKNIGIPVHTEEGSEEELVKKELKTNIERYSAQEFNVEPLRSLIGRSIHEMKRGIELFRDNVRKLTSALTALRSLEGYGYGTEIESIMKDIKNTQKADDVMRRVELLKGRALADQGGKDQNITPRSRILKGLKAASEVLKGSEEDPYGEAASQQVAYLDGMDVDSLMEDLAQLGSEFSDEPEVDEVEKLLREWEREGYFIDRLREQILTSGGDPSAELERFSSEVARIRELKERLDKIDHTGLEESIKKVRIKLPYTYMATDIEHDIQVLERIDRERKEAAKAAEEEKPRPSPEEKGGVKEDTETDEVPEPQAEASQEEPRPTRTVGGGKVEDDRTKGVVEGLEPPQKQKGLKKTEETPNVSGLSVEDVLEKAKEAYGEGDLKKAMSFFEEVLKKDPDNSKARFMIRRIGQKI